MTRSPWSSAAEPTTTTRVSDNANAAPSSLSAASSSVLFCHLGSISEYLVPDLLHEHLVASVRVRPRKRTSKRKQPHHKRMSDIKKVKARHTHSKITPEGIARMMNIGLDKAKQILAATIQKRIWTAIHPIHRRYRIDHLNLHSQRLAGRWYVDWMSARTKSLSQNTGAFVYSNGSMTEVFPMPNHSNVSTATSLKEFCKDEGIPEWPKSDK